jgi:hypothetical protein
VRSLTWSLPLTATATATVFPRNRSRRRRRQGRGQPQRSREARIWTRTNYSRLPSSSNLTTKPSVLPPALC